MVHGSSGSYIMSGVLRGFDPLCHRWRTIEMAGKDLLYHRALRAKNLDLRIYVLAHQSFLRIRRLSVLKSRW